MLGQRSEIANDIRRSTGLGHALTLWEGCGLRTRYIIVDSQNSLQAICDTGNRASGSYRPSRPAGTVKVSGGFIAIIDPQHMNTDCSGRIQIYHNAAAIPD